MDNTSVTDKDDRLDEAIAGASEFIEEYTDRIFIPWTGTKEFDWQSTGKLWLGEDLLSAAPTITYNAAANTVAAGDYFLYPLNAADRNKPYEWIEILLTDDQLWYDDTRQSDIAVTGKWGYSEITKSITTINEGAQYSSSDLTLTVTSGTNIEIGMTLLIESEQLFVENVSTNDVTVIRGVNGTTAAAHDDATAVQAIFPPLQIRMAANALAARAFMRGESQWTDRTQAGDLGFSYFKSMPSEVESALRKFQREVVV
jgi:hypothetical protein